MQEMIDGDMEKREIWAKVLESRKQKGLPYILFKHNVNRFKPQVYKDNNLTIHSSNLCSEIALPSTEDESLICCLSSINLELYDEWKDTEAVKMAVYFLDGVLQEFIAKTEGNYYLAAANRFAKNHRALGLGAMGWHSYLQKNRIPFEGMRAKGLTHKIFEDVSTKATKASKELATIYGEPEILKGYGLRNTTLMPLRQPHHLQQFWGKLPRELNLSVATISKRGLQKGILCGRINT
jgi:ribonucleoside-diphosphate reductase alpha chain